MLYLLYIYVREILGRNVTRLVTSELIVAVAVGFLYGYGVLTADLVGHNVPVARFTEQVLALAGIGLGACLTAVTMAVRLSDADFADYLATEVPSASVNFDAVLFKLSWTAVVNWATLILSTGVLLLSPGSASLFDPHLAAGWKIIIALQLALLVYGVMLLFATVLTISVLGIQRWRWRESRQYGRAGDE
ncbi:hypothetical protein [Azospirillum agricola]|uniref:hypothetical protein n=1 Tax=Azospirillum agricola TaxID=1720247 RepID=UPI000A0F3C13|nr:hypothetical protein [Azospirillum agricola]MBP2227664.1 hypothetical protein [Azospirillum agricola]SMH47893.1 hypothetical protein SAMN02982994_2673 [Azospirillum lipoferum]